MGLMEGLVETAPADAEWRAAAEQILKRDGLLSG